MGKRGYIAIIAVLSIVACYFFYSYMRLKAETIDAMLVYEASADVPDAANEQPEETPEYVTFYICGEVKEPEVYTLPKGSRIFEAIELAGGATEQANFEMMDSVASEIADGQKIYVPNIEDNIDKINYMNNNNSNGSGGVIYTEPKDPNVIVNINTADVEELCKIPGVGESTAKLIYDYRTENGDFVLIEDIMNVPRIGKKTFESIKKNITIE